MKTPHGTGRGPHRSMLAACLALLALLLIPSAHAATQCEALPGLQLDGATVTSSVRQPAGSFVGPDGNGYDNVPAFCRVMITASGAPGSLINMELWLPTETWNGRFKGVGNAGYAGTVAASVPAMVAGLQLGFAVAGTDMGTAPAYNSNADALVGQPQKWVDFGGRATHLMTVLSKQVLSSHYGRGPDYSYFEGCSTGGQQALRLAQDYPADYDGILVGAPANNRTHVHTGILWIYRSLRATPNSLFTSDKVQLVTDSILNACRAKGGGLASDPFLTDPRKCDWDPGVLQCSSVLATNCLHPDQVAAARAIFDGPRNPATGSLIFPGAPMGSESDSQFGWVGIGRSAEPPFGSIYKWVFGLSWAWPTYDFNQDMASVNDLLADMLNANNPDLSAFQQRGGKILGYHGWADPLIAPQDFINYYQRVVQAQSNSAHLGLKRTQAFFRLFMVPGMNHCAFGPGPNAFGNRFSGKVVTPPPLADDAEHNALIALQEWVEQGRAPERITAAKYVQDEPSLGVQMTRPICPLPKLPKYSGSGDPNLASSFVCEDAGSLQAEMAVDD